MKKTSIGSVDIVARAGEGNSAPSWIAIGNLGHLYTYHQVSSVWKVLGTIMIVRIFTRSVSGGLVCTLAHYLPADVAGALLR